MVQKTNPEFLEQLKVDNKCVPCFAVPEQTLRCLVYLLDLYFDKLPPFAKQCSLLPPKEMFQF